MAIQETPILELDRSLKGLPGSLCWGVHYTRLTNLSLEFGQPCLRVIHEPVPNKRVARGSRSVPLREIRRRLNRRRIVVRGRWNLWIYLANWRIVRSGVCLASRSSSMRKISPALLDLQGQRLVRAVVDPRSGATQFEFDLDTILEVRRKDRRSTDELWLLYGLDGYQRSVRGDGTFKRKRCRL
jgi:hypothetical protein